MVFPGTGKRRLPAPPDPGNPAEEMSKILCEYDFIQERMLTRAQALSKATRSGILIFSNHGPTERP